MTIPKFDFAYFDPDQAQYVAQTLGPFEVDVLASEEGAGPLLASPDVPVAERRIDILAEDIRPLIERTGTLEARRSRPYGWVALAAAPVVAYLVLAVLLARRRRFATDIGWARSQQARTRGLQRLRDVADSPEPAVALYRALVSFVADTLNLEPEGLTSADVRRDMDIAQLPPDLIEKTVQILKACERARYASQRLSNDEVNALLSAAETCMNELDATAKRERRI